jgi:hypothetical protein
VESAISSGIGDREILSIASSGVFSNYNSGEVKSFFAVIKGVSNPSLVSVNAIYVPTKVNAAEVIELAGTLDRMVSNS